MEQILYEPLSQNSVNNLLYSKENGLERISSALREVLRFLREERDKSDHMFKRIHEIHRNVLKLGDTVDNNCSSVIDIQNCFNNYANSIKLLLFNKPSNLNEDIKGEFCLVVGSVPWHVIIDLDHTSRRTGIFYLVSNILEAKKEIKVITYKEVKVLTEQDFRFVGSGKKTIWLLAKVCKDISCPRTENKQVQSLCHY